MITDKQFEDALIKIRDSKRINKQHPEAETLAKELLSKYYFKKRNGETTTGLSVFV